MEKTRYNQKDIAVVGLMISLVFIGTFYFKIPTAFGYTHLGDCMIILATCLLGTQKGAIAGALGAGLGYALSTLLTLRLCYNMLYQTWLPKRQMKILKEVCFKIIWEINRTNRCLSYDYIFNLKDISGFQKLTNDII